MGAYNLLRLKRICPNCGKQAEFRFQFKYGDTWLHEYRIGDQLKWGGNDIGQSGASRVVVDAVAEGCPLCGFEDQMDYEIWLEQDKIIDLKPASGKYDFVLRQNTYLVLEN
jgi:hypothetical protein